MGFKFRLILFQKYVKIYKKESASQARVGNVRQKDVHRMSVKLQEWEK